jgi:hypothetical protein
VFPMPGRQQRSRRIEVVLCKRANLEPTHHATIATPINESHNLRRSLPKLPVVA